MIDIEKIVQHLDDITWEEISQETKDVWREYLTRILTVNIDGKDTVGVVEVNIGGINYVRRS